MAVSNGCQQWLSAMAAVVAAVTVVAIVDVAILLSHQKRPFFEGFGQNGRHHAHQREKTIQIINFSAQTELFSRILIF